MFSHILSCVFIYYTFHIPFFFIYFLYFTCSYPFSCTILCTFYILYSCTVHALFSYTYIHLLFISYTVFLLYFSFFTFILVPSYTFIFYLSYTLCFRILSLLFLCSYTYFHINLYCTSCSCNCILSSHSKAMLLISYHILCIYISFMYTFHYLLYSCLQIP